MKILAIFGIIFVLFFPSMLFADHTVLPIEIQADKEAYNRGETIHLTGSIHESLVDKPEFSKIHVTISDSFGTIVWPTRITYHYDGVIDYQIKIPRGWISSGPHIITAEIEGPFTAETTFFLEPLSDSEPIDSPDRITSKRKVIDTDYIVDYSIYKGSVKTITIDESQNSVVVFLYYGKPGGEITLSLPRELIDSKIQETDIDFVVEVDGVTTQFEEIRTEHERILTVNFKDDSEKIEIIGTQVVPEFHEIAILVLGSGIIGIIAISKKFGILKILNS